MEGSLVEAINRMKILAGINEDNSVVPIGTIFPISEPSNMHKAVDAILAAGLEVDLGYSMGTFYFTFKSTSIANEAHKIVSGVIDKKKELKWQES